MELGEYIGSKIKARREHLNIGQDELAKMLNTSRVTVTRYENGSRKVNQDTLFKIAQLLKVDISYFYPGHDDAIRDNQLTENQRLVAYSIDPDISDEERKDIIEMVKLAMKHRRRA